MLVEKVPRYGMWHTLTFQSAVGFHLRNEFAELRLRISLMIRISLVLLLMQNDKEQTSAM